MPLYYQYLYALSMASIDIITFSLLKLKYTHIIQSAWLIPLAMLAYSFQPLLFYNGLLFENMSILNLLWNVISSVLVTLIGLLIFNEKISMYQGVGIVFSFIGIILLGIKDD